MGSLIRIQDHTGRGPWRPGFSNYWMTDENPCIGKPITEDFPKLKKILAKAHKQGKHAGCAVREDKINIWFTEAELKRLFSLGFYFVGCDACEVLAESDTQVIIAHTIPLRFLSKKSN